LAAAGSKGAVAIRLSHRRCTLNYGSGPPMRRLIASARGVDDDLKAALVTGVRHDQLFYHPSCTVLRRAPMKCSQLACPWKSKWTRRSQAITQ
jgi:hypothetical protein